MAVDLDDPPIYDPLTENLNFMNGIWISWITSFVQSLSEYLSQYGIFIPRLTTEQRDSIQVPEEGQMIYNITSTSPTTVVGPQIWRDGQWQTITTVP